MGKNRVAKKLAEDVGYTYLGACNKRRKISVFSGIAFGRSMACISGVTPSPSPWLTSVAVAAKSCLEKGLDPKKFHAKKVTRINSLETKIYLHMRTSFRFIASPRQVHPSAS
jgi:hypothetical protein